MAYTDKEFAYYAKHPKKITSELPEDLLLALVDIDSSWMGFMKPHTLDFIEKAAEVDPTTFKFAERSVLTPQFLEKIISKSPFLIQYVYSPSDTLIKLALSKDLNTIQFFTELSPTLQKFVVEKNGMMLKHIISAEQTEELIEIAITQNIEAYKYAAIKNLRFDKIILEKDPTRVDLISEYNVELIDYILDYNPRTIVEFFGTPELTIERIKRSIEKDPEIFRLIENPDLDLMEFTAKLDLNMMQYMDYNEDFIKSMLPINGLALQYLRKKDLRSIVTAMENNVLALDYLQNPRNFLIMYAFELDAIALKYIENPTPEQYQDAVQRNGYTIEYVPEEFQTKTIQTAALAGAGIFAIPFITKPADEDIILEIIRKEPSYIFKIENPTDAELEAAFDSAGQLMLYFDNWEERFSTSVIEAALSGDGSILEKVKNKTIRLSIAAITSYPLALAWVTNQTYDMIKIAIEKDPRTLYFADKSLIDGELLDLALSIDPDFLTLQTGEMTFEQWQNRINN